MSRQCLLLGISVLLLAPPAQAAWLTGGTPVCTAPGDHYEIHCDADHAGGVLVAWRDTRNGSDSKIYAHRVTISGDLAPGWPVDGLLTNTNIGQQLNPWIASDGAGGAFVAWQQFANSEFGSCWVQHLTGSGSIDPSWPAAGVRVAPAPADPTMVGDRTPSIVSDGAGGCIVVWVRSPLGLSGTMLARRLTSLGATHSGWPDGGVMVVDPAGQGRYPIATDGAGGAYVEAARITVFNDPPGPRAYEFGLFHVGAAGSVSEPYGSGAFGYGSEGDLVADGAGGVLAVGRATVHYPELDLWSNRGAVCKATGEQDNGRVCQDAFGGFYVTWQDRRAAPQTVYATRLQGSGSVMPGWPMDGLALCSLSTSQSEPVVASDAGSGAFVVWTDWRANAGPTLQEADIYGTHLAADATIVPGWPPNGRPICTAPSLQQHPQLVPDGVGGAIAVWEDQRDIQIAVYATRLVDDTPVPVNVSLVDVAALPGRVALTWWTPAGAGFRGVLYRMEDGTRWQTVAELAGGGDGRVTYEDQSVVVGRTYWYRLGYLIAGSQTFTPAVEVTVPREPTLSLQGARPNPTRGEWTVAFELASDAPAQLELFDPGGRRLAARDVSSLGPGAHVIRWTPVARPGPGILWLRLTQEGRARTARVAVLP